MKVFFSFANILTKTSIEKCYHPARNWTVSTKIKAIYIYIYILAYIPGQRYEYLKMEVEILGRIWSFLWLLSFFITKIARDSEIDIYHTEKDTTTSKRLSDITINQKRERRQCLICIICKRDIFEYIPARQMIQDSKNAIDRNQHDFTHMLMPSEFCPTCLIVAIS